MYNNSFINLYKDVIKVLTCGLLFLWHDGHHPGLLGGPLMQQLWTAIPRYLIDKL